MHNIGLAGHFDRLLEGSYGLEFREKPEIWTIVSNSEDTNYTNTWIYFISILTDLTVEFDSNCVKLIDFSTDTWLSFFIQKILVDKNYKNKASVRVE